MRGFVKWYNIKKGYGFIEGVDGNDYFIHYSNLPEGKFILNEKDEVEFEYEETSRGKQAINLEIIK